MAHDREMNRAIWLILEEDDLRMAVERMVAFLRHAQSAAGLNLERLEVDLDYARWALRDKYGVDLYHLW